MRLVRNSLAIALMSPMLVFATYPGQFMVADIQQICLMDNGTWYGTTFPDWGGGWRDRRYPHITTHIYGDDSAGAGHHSMIFVHGTSGERRQFGSWTEWRDDLSSHRVIQHATLKFVKANCDPPANVAESQKATPQQ
jgi:hypothetical protein